MAKMDKAGSLLFVPCLGSDAVQVLEMSLWRR
jgi:hypothetical protein